MFDVEIADEADADAEIVVAIVGGLGVGAPFLFRPAGADFDLAITGFGAVANDEVIAEFVPAFGAMIAVELGGGAGWRGAVVNNNPSPRPSGNSRHPFARNARRIGQ